MFGNNSKNEPKANGGISTPSTTSSNSLVQGTQIEGSVIAESDIRIDGLMKGNLICKGKVIIGPTGQISGDVQCENAVIEGRFEGILIVSDVLHIKETARVEGDIATQKLIVQPGSVFNVKCKMGNVANSPKMLRVEEEEGVEINTLSKSKASMS